MQLEIRHRTHYTYAQPVRESRNEVHLQPPTTGRQTVHSFLLKILPGTRLKHYSDFYSNTVHYFELPEPHSSLAVESNVLVTTCAPENLPLNARPGSLKGSFTDARCYEFLQASRYVDTSPEVWRLAVDAVGDERDLWQQALRIMGFVHGHIAYQGNSTRVHTHTREVLTQRRGVCQDLAHVMLSLCRSMKIPARYVSGYLATETASATHAWTEVFVPGHGWQPLDPTHNSQPGETYVQIGAGRDYADVPPIRGTYRGTTDHTMEVSVKIERRQA